MRSFRITLFFQDPMSGIFDYHVKESGVNTHIIEEVKILSETLYKDLPDKAKERLDIEKILDQRY